MQAARWLDRNEETCEISQFALFSNVPANKEAIHQDMVMYTCEERDFSTHTRIRPGRVASGAFAPWDWRRPRTEHAPECDGESCGVQGASGVLRGHSHWDRGREESASGSAKVLAGSMAASDESYEQVAKGQEIVSLLSLSW